MIPLATSGTGEGPPRTPPPCTTLFLLALAASPEFPLIYSRRSGPISSAREAPEEFHQVPLLDLIEAKGLQGRLIVMAAADRPFTAIVETDYCLQIGKSSVVKVGPGVSDKSQ